MCYVRPVFRVLFANPVITKSFAHVDIDIAGFGAHASERNGWPIGARSVRSPHPRTRLVETLYRLLRMKWNERPVNCELRNLTNPDQPIASDLTGHSLDVTSDIRY